MLEEILNLPEFPSNFNIEDQKKTFSNFGGNLPMFFHNKNEISKTEVIELIGSKKHNHKIELIAILFWGIYFKVMARSPKSILSLVKFIESDKFENEMNGRKMKIVESEKPSELFKSFQKELHIPGLDYAYFTKLFFFYREALVPQIQTYPILDKWLSNAWCALDGSINNNIQVYNRFYKAKTNHFFDGTLKRDKPQAYKSYIEYMNNLVENRDMDIIALEEKLFGADRTKYKENNPRNLYRGWAVLNSIPLKDPKITKKLNALNNSKKTKVKRTNNLKNKVQKITGPLFPNETKIYLGLYVDSEHRTKEGYIDDKGWLNASPKLKEFLSIYDCKWEEGKTKGGTREKYKTKFDTKEKCVEFLKKNKVLADA